MGVGVRPFIVALLGAVVFLLYPLNSYATGEYYIELGSESSEEEAIAQWKLLADKHKEVLGSMQFFPTTVLHKSDNKVTTRIQAGPLNTKLDAYRICGKLFEDNVPCFVVEGEHHEASVNIVREQKQEMAEAAESLPWLAGQLPVNDNIPRPLATTPAFQPQPVEVVEQEEEDEGFFSWIFGSDDDEEKAPAPVAATAEAAPASNAKGEVEVAEAIRVPLTNDEMLFKPEFTKQSQPIKPVAIPIPTEERASEPVSEPGWVNVRSFAEEDSASLFWQTVREQEPIQTAGLRVRVLEPLVERNRGEVSLNIGPFAGRADALTFCREIIRRKNADLYCEFQQQEEQAVASKLVSPRYHHSQRYNRRQAAMEARYGRRGSSMLQPSRPSKVFWLQVAMENTQMQALQRWDDLREQHPDLLEGLRSSVSATLMDGTKYMVRVGPLDSNAAAAELCSSLKNRGVSCKIYSNM